MGKLATGDVVCQPYLSCFNTSHKFVPYFKKTQKTLVHFFVLYFYIFGGDILLNNDCLVKGKVDSSLNEAFRKILKTLNMSQQDFIEKAVKDFVLNNLTLIMNKGSEDKH